MSAEAILTIIAVAGFLIPGIRGLYRIARSMEEMLELVKGLDARVGRLEGKATSIAAQTKSTAEHVGG